MRGNANRFALDLEKEAKDLSEVDFRDFRDKVVFEGLNSVVKLSPVDRGTFRQNWHVTAGAPDDAVDQEASGGSKGDPPSVDQVVDTHSELAVSDAYDTVFIQNNLPYAEPLEHGHSGQAPGGMVRITLEKLEAMREGP